MKKLLGIVVLGLLWCNTGFAAKAYKNHVMVIGFIKKFTAFLKKLFSIFLIFNLTWVSTAQAAGVFVDSFSVSSQFGLAEGVAFNNDGTKMFVTGQTADFVGEYTLTTGFDVSTASFVDSFDVSNEETAPAGLAFNNDGTKMFVLGRSGRDVTEYTLTTGFDVSSASVVDSFSVSTQEDDPAGLAFNNDGTKMFVAGIDEDKVHEYTLTTGFDVSTASFVDSLDISSQENHSADLAFNNDGTKMFVVGRAGDDVNLYTLTTGFDVSTASFVDSFDVSKEETAPAGLAFNDDGTKMFITGWTGDDVNEYTLSCAYKVTSSSTCDDPSTIKEVRGLIDAQIETAKNFAKDSSASALKRLSILRAEKHYGSTSQNININFQNPALAQLADVMPVSTSGKLNPLQKIIPNDWATWSEGSVSFGKIGETNLSSAQDMTSLGISIGADKKVNENRLLGVVLRVGNNDVDVGTYGSAVDTDAISLSLYGSNSLDEDQFFDHVIGVSLLNSDIVRKNSGNTNTQTGDRDGKQIFSSLKFGREFEYNDMNITPTGRMDGSFTHLNAYTESGNEAIKYNDQDIVSLMTSLGMMIDRDISLENSIVISRVNLEYGKDFASSSKVVTRYTSDNNTTYSYQANKQDRDILTAGFGFDFTHIQGLTISADYQKQKIISEGSIDTLLLAASFVSKRETEYAMTLEGTDDFAVGLNVAKNINGFNFTVGSNYTLMSEIPDYGAILKVSNTF